MKETLFDLDNGEQKALLVSHIRSLQGIYRITIIKFRKRRSNRQLGYYHGVVVDLFAEHLYNNGWDLDDEALHEFAHERLRAMFGLRKSAVNKKTGETEESIRSTADYTTVEFIDYNDRCCQWMAESEGIVVPPPDPYYKREAP